MEPKDVKQDAGVTSTSEPGGKEPDPKDQTPVSPTPGDEPQDKPKPEAKVDEPKDKQVPFESYEAERKKRQEVEDELNKLRDKPPEFTPNWDAILGGVTPGQEPHPQQQPAQEQSTNPFDPYNQWLRSNWDDHPVETMLGVLNLYDAQKRQQETQAMQFVGEDRYRNLPMHNVSEQELMAVSQNPVALRALIAAVKAGSSMPAKTSAGPNVTKSIEDQQKTWEEQKEKEIRERVLKELKNAPGVTSEGAAGPAGPGEPVYELDETGLAYAKKRGFDKDPTKLKEFAKRYNAELERQSQR